MTYKGLGHSVIIYGKLDSPIGCAKSLIRGRVNKSSFLKMREIDIMRNLWVSEVIRMYINNCVALINTIQLNRNTHPMIQHSTTAKKKRGPYDYFCSLILPVIFLISCTIW